MDDAPVHGCEMHPDYQYPEKESNLPARLRRPSTAAVGRGKQFSVQESNLSTGLRKPSAAAVGRRVFTRSRFQVPGSKLKTTMHSTWNLELKSQDGRNRTYLNEFPRLAASQWPTS